MPRSPRRGSRILWALLAILILLVGFVVASELAGWPFLRQPLETRLARQLERPVRLTAPFKLHLLGGVDLRAGGLWIAAPEGFDLPHLVDASDVELALRYRDLLALRKGAPLRIAGLDVGRIDARLVRRADNAASWQFGPPPTPGEERPPQPPPQVEHLVVRDGAIVVDDPISKVKLKATFATDEGSAEQAPSSRTSFSGRLRGRPLEGEFSTAGFMRLAERGEAAEPLPARARIEYGGVHAEFDGTVTDLLSARGLKGKTMVRGPSLSLLGDLFGLVLPTTGPFSLRGTLSKDEEVWRADVASATVGRSALRGEFLYDPRADVPLLEGKLSGKRFILADLAPAFGTRNPDGSPAPPPPGKVLPDRKLNLDALQKMEAHIKVALDHVELGEVFSQPIAPLNGQLDLENGRLALTGIDARTAQGSLAGDIAIDAKPKIAQWQVGLNWSDIDLEQWFGAGAANGGKGEGDREGQRDAEAGAIDQPYLTGTLHGHSKLTGSGDSVAELLASLDGQLTLFVRGGSMSHLVIELLGLDVAQSLGVLLRGDQRLETRCAVAEFVARDGRMTPQVALIDTPVTLVLVDGTIDFGAEDLNLRLTAKPRNFSPFTLRSPIRVRGSFADPGFAPEARPLAAKALASIGLAFVAPLAAILPFIDPGEDVGTPCRSALAELDD